MILMPSPVVCTSLPPVLIIEPNSRSFVAVTVPPEILIAAVVPNFVSSAKTTLPSMTSMLAPFENVVPPATLSVPLP